jgi:hypothetical protein
MEEFEDFEGYVNKIECWGSRSGIVKVIPPKEWLVSRLCKCLTKQLINRRGRTDALPPMKDQLSPVKIKSPIEQHMLGRGGLFRQENIEKRRIMSVREWAELCGKEEFCAPGVNDVGLHARSVSGKTRPSRKGRKRAEITKSENAEPDPEGDCFELKQEAPDEDQQLDDVASLIVSPPYSAIVQATPTVDHDPDADSKSTGSDPQDTDMGSVQPVSEEDKLQPKPKRPAQTREVREANLAERTARDEAFLETFDPHSHWLPQNTTAADYTPEFCQKLERQYWRNCGLGRPAWYGADTQGSSTSVIPCYAS